jgi:hypothetical protein
VKPTQKVIQVSCLILIFFFALGLSIPLCTAHLFFVPAINFDESWAGRIAHRIAFEPGFWPFQGMNAYSAVLSNYVAALFFRMFGSGLVVLRLSGVVQVCLGITCLSLALHRWGEKKAALLFPFFTLCFPALMFNHRYGIEATTFHVLCFGIFSLGLSLVFTQNLNLGRTLIAVGAILGIVSHPFFIAPSLAALLLRVLKPQAIEGKERKYLLWLLLFFFLFFLRVLWLIPEKDKGMGLVGLNTILIVLVYWHSYFIQNFLSARNLKIFYGIAGVLSIPALTFLFCYASTPWAILTATGKITHPSLMIFDAIWVLAVLFYGFWSQSVKKLPAKFLTWGTLSITLCALILIQPSPRCYEIGMIFLSLGFSLLMSKFSNRWSTLFITTWVLLGVLQWKFNYIDPVLSNQTVHREIRLLFVKGISEAYPSHQSLFKKVVDQDCKTTGIDLNYSRTREALEFVSRGKWFPFPNPKCHLSFESHE